MDKLQNINMDKKRRIISKAMYIQLFDYYLSNEYITNYSDVKTIRLYCKLTEMEIDIETYTNKYITNFPNKTDLNVPNKPTNHETNRQHTFHDS